MNKLFIKDGLIQSFAVNDNKVCTTIVLDNFKVTNPTLEQFLSTGWDEYTPPEQEQYVPTLEELVERRIRVKYSINQEFEVLRKRDIEPDAFNEYFTFVEECIAAAKRELELWPQKLDS